MVLRFLVGLGLGLGIGLVLGLGIGLVLGTGLVLRIGLGLGLGFGWEGAIAITGHVFASPLSVHDQASMETLVLCLDSPRATKREESEKKAEEEEEEDATVRYAICFSNTENS